MPLVTVLRRTAPYAAPYAVPYAVPTHSLLWRPVARCNLLPTRVAYGIPRKPCQRAPQELQAVRLHYCAACNTPWPNDGHKKARSVAGSVVLCGGVAAIAWPMWWGHPVYPVVAVV